MKKSLIWTLDCETFREIVSSSNTLAEILRKIGLKASGNYKILKKRIDEQNIDISHIKLGIDSNSGRKFDITPKNALSFEEIFVENSKYLGGGKGLKNYLFKHNLIVNKCAICDCDAEWQGKPLSLQLDHINGVSNDNRLDNLRLLCPNCHSQTETFSGRNNKW